MRGVTDAASALIERWFWPVALLILLVAAAVRLPELALNPFHHDEGVNGFFTTNLVRQGTYTYDPANYHGPSLYYFALVSEIVFGLTSEAMRLVPVAFGLLLVAMVFPLRRYLGSLATLTAAALLALSPAMVYVSRYFIHEMLLASLSLSLVVAAVFYLDRRQPKYLLAGAVAAALLFATKETGIITVAVLLIAVAIAHVYVGLRRPRRGQPRERAGPARRRRSVWIDGVEYQPARNERGSGAPGSIWRTGIPAEHLVGAAVVFLVIYVLLYSSFFTNFPQGLVDSLATFTLWVQHSEATQVAPFTRYFEWMIPLDLPILVLGVAGGLVVAFRARDRLSVVIGLWAAGITTAYSLIQYKTPWIVVNMLVPLALLGGLLAAELWRSRLRLAVPLVIAAAVSINGYQAIDLNFNRYDDQTEAYVYVHSTRDMLAMIEDIEAIGVRAGTGRDTGIAFVTEEYWPLPWYFRNDPKAVFWGKIDDGPIVTDPAPIVVANVNQEGELAPKIAGKYDLLRQYNLRPGVDLAVYVRSDIPKE